jgi:hypothetical protein
MTHDPNDLRPLVGEAATAIADPDKALSGDRADVAEAWEVQG